jgi:cytochrome P450
MAMGRDNPPGPRDWFFGFALGRRLRTRTLEMMTDLARNYGDLAYFRLGPFRVYSVNHPALVREVLVTRAKQFPKAVRSTRVLSQFDGQGLTVTQGDFWLRQRRLVQPAFHARRLGRYADITVEFTRRRMERWQPGVVYDVQNEMTDLAIDVIAKALFDVEVGAQVDQLRAAVAVFSETLFREISAPCKLPDWLPLPAKRRKRWAIRTVDTMIRDIIRARRAQGEDKGDLLSMLLLAVDEAGDGGGMTDEQARDEAVALFRGGHDTTAAGLAWIWYLLARHPEVEARLVQEVAAVLQGRPATFADLPRLGYTEMVVKEALRLYPPIWALFGRETTAEVELGGFMLPRGAQVLILPWGLHRNPRFFENAESFDPDRFGPERLGGLTPDAYIPFGLGPHICIGASFAMMQMTLTVATVMQRWRWTLAPGVQSIDPEPHIAIRPKGGLPMTPIPSEPRP